MNLKIKIVICLLISTLSSCSQNPFKPYLKLNKAAQFLQKGQKPEAEKIIKESLIEFKEYYTPYLFYASFLHTKGLNTEANQYYSKAYKIFHKQYIKKWEEDKTNTAYTTSIINGIPQHWSKNVIEWIENEIERKKYKNALKIIENNEKGFFLSEFDEIKLLLLKIRLNNKLRYDNKTDFNRIIENKLQILGKNLRKDNEIIALQFLYLEYYELTNNQKYLNLVKKVLSSKFSDNNNNIILILKIYYFAHMKDKNKMDYYLNKIPNRFKNNVSIELILKRIYSVLKSRNFYNRKII